MSPPDSNPFENPYASPASPPRDPSPIPDIAAPDDAIDGPDAIRLSGDVTGEVAARALTLYQAKSTPSVLAVGVLVILLGGMGYMIYMVPVTVAFLGYIGIAMVIVVIRHLVTKSSRQAFRQGPFTGCVSSRGIELTHDEETVRLKWTFITGQLTDGIVLLLYAYPSSVLVLPRSAFASHDDWERMQEWMERARVPIAEQGLH